MAADTIVTGSKLTAIANAIRSKLGVATQYTLDQMAAAIASIPSGGSDDSWARSVITQQGVTSQSSLDQFRAIAAHDFDAAQGAALGGVTDDLEAAHVSWKARPYALAWDMGLDEVVVPDGMVLSTCTFSRSGATRIAFAGGWSYASGNNINHGYDLTMMHGTTAAVSNSPFTDAEWVEALDLSGFSSQSPNGFNDMAYLAAGCTRLKACTLPGIAGATKLVASAFADCGALERLTVPANFTNLRNASAFQYCSSLVELDIEGSPDMLGGTYSHLFGYGFDSNNTTFERLIIRGSAKAKITNSGGTELSSNGFIFGGAYNSQTSGYDPNVPANLTIYVPDALVATYKADANWGNYASIITGISDLPAS